MGIPENKNPPLYVVGSILSMLIYLPLQPGISAQVALEQLEALQQSCFLQFTILAFFLEAVFLPLSAYTATDDIVIATVTINNIFFILLI